MKHKQSTKVKNISIGDCYAPVRISKLAKKGRNKGHVPVCTKCYPGYCNLVTRIYNHSHIVRYVQDLSKHISTDELLDPDDLADISDDDLFDSEIPKTWICYCDVWNGSQCDKCCKYRIPCKLIKPMPITIYELLEPRIWR
jgi:hypothetical protein